MTKLSALQREVERRKACYQECIVRHALLKRSGWVDPLFEDLKGKFQGNEFEWQRQKREQHLNTISLVSICEARGYRIPLEKDDDLMKVCNRLNKYDEFNSGGVPYLPHKYYDTIRVRPVGGVRHNRMVGDLDDKYELPDKYEGLARLEIARRHPERRRQVFDWDKKSENPRQRNADEYWAALLIGKPWEDSSYNHLQLMWDTADFHANDLLRIIYLYGQMPDCIKVKNPKWRPSELLDRDPDFSAIIEQKIIKALMEFKYWMDEEPMADSCSRLIEARKKHPRDTNKDENELKYEMTFWSENHQILFPSAEYLIGQLFPDELFMPGRSYREGGENMEIGDYNGRQRMARAKTRILQWLNERLHFGFSEWNSPGYYKEHLQALLNLADFCLDSEIQMRTNMVIDLMFFDLARFTHKGHFGPSGGRVYFEHKNCGWGQGVCDLIEILFGTHEEVYAGIVPAAVMLSSSHVYTIPDAIIAIGKDEKAQFTDRSRVSLNFDETDEYGIGFQKEEDVLRWWSRGAWFSKQVINQSRQVAIKYHLMYTEPFSLILPITGSVDNKILYTIASLGILLTPPLGFSLLGLLVVVDEEDVANIASVITEGSALTRANHYTYRTQHVMLSSVQNFRSGQYNFQTHPCQATLSMGAMVWTTHPSAGSNLDNFKIFLKTIGAAIGATGGGILGAALGKYAYYFLGGVSPLAHIAAGILGTVKGFNAGKDAGELLGETKIIEANHDGPNWWTGSVTLPRIVQHENTAIIAYNPNEFQVALFGSRTHAWFPKAAFDQNADEDDWGEHNQLRQLVPFPTPIPTVDTSLKTPIIPSLTPVPSINSNIDTGAWIFGRVTDGYVALYSAQKPEWTTEGDWKDREIIAEGKRNIFILQVGSKEEFGSYINFKRKVLSSRIHINGLHWAPANFQCSFDIANGSRLELHYSENQVRFGGVQFSDDEFPRYDNIYAQVAWQQNKYIIQHQAYSLVHDIIKPQRRLGGKIINLSHSTNLNIYCQNMGLFPSDLLGLPVKIIPLYKGTERERALQKLIQVLREKKFHIVGLNEMWVKSDRKMILKQLGDIYKYHLEGPDESDVDWFDGGLLLLSRHKIIKSNFTIYHKCMGDDCFANKGALHARLQVLGLPCNIDVFVTHLQSPDPLFGKPEEAKEIVRKQIQQLSVFIHSCRDMQTPAILMGDLNVDGIKDINQYNFLKEQLYCSSDLKPRFELKDNDENHFFEATHEEKNISSFNNGNDQRAKTDSERFGKEAQRLDYFFTWNGSIFHANYPKSYRKVVNHQSSIERDMSDHYGIEVRLSEITQKIINISHKLGSIHIRLSRFWCLQTTSIVGDDEVEFILRGIPAIGQQQQVNTSCYKEVNTGSEHKIEVTTLEFQDPGQFLLIVVSGQEVDVFSDDDLGTTSIKLSRSELVSLIGFPSKLVFPRLTKDNGEFAVEVELVVN